MSASPSVGELSPEPCCTEDKTFRLLNTRPRRSQRSPGHRDPSTLGGSGLAALAPITYHGLGVRLLAPLLLLLAYGIAFAAAALGRSLLVYDDHPGQLYRLWHVVTYGPAPWAWDPGWWAGYPEMQFYPPGFAYAGALLYTACVGAVSVGAVYQALLWLVYLAPGVTVFAVLARVLRDGWLALPGALVALTLSAGLASGIEGGVHVGMVAARLGWALLPLLPLALGRFVEGTGTFPVM